MLKLLVDTREQKPLEFREGIFESTERKTLVVGDYACQIGEEVVPIFWERKGLGDLFSTLGSAEYERFKREMQRARDNNIKLILLIEGTMREVQTGYERSQFDGDSMLKKLAMLYVKYDLEYYFCCDRRVMSRRIEDTFQAVERLWKKEKRAI